jgi:hypothetical protein
MKNYIYLFIIIIIIIVILFKKKYIYIKVKDGKKFYVEDLKNNDEIKSAEIFFEINKRCEKLIKVLDIKYPNDEGVKRLKKKYQWYDLREDTSTYTINKGDKIHIKIKDRNNNYYSINTLMFIVLHELTHVMIKNYDKHNDFFWSKNKWLMREATLINIFIPIDYSLMPIQYGNIKINSNPLFN